MKTRQLAVALFCAVLTTTQAFSAETDQPQAHEALTVTLDVLNGFSDADTAKVNQAAAAMQSVLNSEQFHQAVINFTYTDDNQVLQHQFVQNQMSDANGNLVQENMSNEQVYEALIASRETYLNNVDHSAHLDLSLYSPPFYKKWSVVGYGYPGQPQIFMNWNYFNKFTVGEVAGNITHEWTHKLGFDHDYKRTSRRPYSVPYAIGQMIVRMVTADTAD